MRLGLSLRYVPQWFLYRDETQIFRKERSPCGFFENPTELKALPDLVIPTREHLRLLDFDNLVKHKNTQLFNLALSCLKLLRNYTHIIC